MSRCFPSGEDPYLFTHYSTSSSNPACGMGRRGCPPGSYNLNFVTCPWCIASYQFMRDQTSAEILHRVTEGRPWAI